MVTVLLWRPFAPILALVCRLPDRQNVGKDFQLPKTLNAARQTMDRIDLYIRLWLIWCALLIVGFAYVRLKVSP